MLVRIKFDVTGMTCAACSARVEKVTMAVEGVEQAEVNLLAGTMVIEAASEAVVDSVTQAVVAAGYGASVAGEKKQPENKNETHGSELGEMKKRIIGSAVFLTVLMYFTMGHMVGLPAPHWYHGTENGLERCFP